MTTAPVIFWRGILVLTPLAILCFAGTALERLGEWCQRGAMRVDVTFDRIDAWAREKSNG